MKPILEASDSIPLNHFLIYIIFLYSILFTPHLITKRGCCVCFQWKILRIQQGTEYKIKIIYQLFSWPNRNNSTQKNMIFPLSLLSPCFFQRIANLLPAWYYNFRVTMVTWGDPELSCCDSSTISFITGEWCAGNSFLRREHYLQKVLERHISRKCRSLTQE